VFLFTTEASQATGISICIAGALFVHNYIVIESSSDDLRLTECYMVSVGGLVLIQRQRVTYP
jgi:hypothetical protein